MTNNKSMLTILTLGTLTISSCIFGYEELTDKQLKAYLSGRLRQIVAPSISDSQADHELNQITKSALQIVLDSNWCYALSELAKAFGGNTTCTYSKEYVETALRTVFLEFVKQKAAIKYGNSVGENVAMRCDAIFRENPRIPNGSMRDFIGDRFDRYIEEQNKIHAQQAYSERPVQTSAPAYAPTTNGYPTATPAPRPTTTPTPFTQANYPISSNSYSTPSPAPKQPDLNTPAEYNKRYPKKQYDDCPIMGSDNCGGLKSMVFMRDCRHGACAQCLKQYHLDTKITCRACNRQLNQNDLVKNPKCPCGNNVQPNDKCSECREKVDLEGLKKDIAAKMASPAA